jgi:RecA-family ATPase
LPALKRNPPADFTALGEEFKNTLVTMTTAQQAGRDAANETVAFLDAARRFNEAIEQTNRKPAANDNRAAAAIGASPWNLPDASSIPPRAWLYGHHYIRKFVTVTISPGGVGKTSLGMVEALSMATGRDLLGEHVHKRSRVWIWNGEDPQEELDRRLAAACRHYGISAADIHGWLFVDSGRRMPLITATQTKDGARIAVPVVEALCKEIAANQIDVMIVDPFVSSHAISENDNMAMDAVVKQTWATIADRTNCSVDLVHHAKKLGGQEVNAESARGGVALIGAARAARVLNPMSAEEANNANVENRHLHFRTTDAKANLAPRSDKSDWYQMVGHDLGNATAERPSDHIGVCTPWRWPNAMADVRVSDLLAVQKVINAGSYKDSVQAKNWAGHAVAEAMGFDLEDGKEKAKAKQCLAEWKKSGALRVEQKEDENRRQRPFVVVGEWANDP